MLNTVILPIITSMTATGLGILLVWIFNRKRQSDERANQITRIMNEISDVRNKVANGVDRSILETEKLRQDVKEEIAELRQDVRKMDGDIGEMKRDIEKIDGDIGEMKRDIEKMDGDIEKIDKRVSENTHLIQNLMSIVADLQSMVRDNISRQS